MKKKDSLSFFAAYSKLLNDRNFFEYLITCKRIGVQQAILIKGKVIWHIRTHLPTLGIYLSIPT